MSILRRNRAPKLHSIDDDRRFTAEQRVAAVFLSSFLVAACTSSTTSSVAGSRPSTPVASGSTFESPSSSPGVEVTFDSRASATTKPGFSNVIYVYRGPSVTDVDRHPAGTYEDGQKATAICITIGRTVNADTAVGERPGSSDEWVRLKNIGAYATLLYLQPDRALGQLPTCPADNGPGNISATVSGPSQTAK